MPIRCRSAGHRSSSLHRAHVRDQRIEPDVEDVMAFDRRRNAPVNIGARNGKIVEALLHERDDLVAPVIRLHELGILLIQLQQPPLERRQFEKVILLGNGFGGTPTFRAGIAGLGVVNIQFVVDAVLTGVAAFVDVPVVAAAFEQPAHGLVVPEIGGADEVVVIDPELPPQVREFHHHPGAVLFRIQPRRSGRLLHVAAVLVGSGGENHRIAGFHFLKALD